MVQLPDISGSQCFVASCSQCWAILPLVIWPQPILSCANIAECNSGVSWYCILRISTIYYSIVSSFSFCSIHWCSCLVMIFVTMWCVCWFLQHFVSLLSYSILKFLGWISVHWKIWFCVYFSFLHSGQRFVIFSCCSDCLQLLIMNSLFLLVSIHVLLLVLLFWVLLCVLFLLIVCVLSSWCCWRCCLPICIWLVDIASFLYCAVVLLCTFSVCLWFVFCWKTVLPVFVVWLSHQCLGLSSDFFGPLLNCCMLYLVLPVVTDFFF